MAPTVTLFSLSLRILTPGGSSVTGLDSKTTLANIATLTLGQFISCFSALFHASATSYYSIDGEDRDEISTIRMEFWHASMVCSNVYCLRPTGTPFSDTWVVPLAHSWSPKLIYGLL